MRAALACGGAAQGCQRRSRAARSPAASSTSRAQPVQCRQQRRRQGGGGAVVTRRRCRRLLRRTGHGRGGHHLPVPAAAARQAGRGRGARSSRGAWQRKAAAVAAIAGLEAQAHRDGIRRRGVSGQPVVQCLRQPVAGPQAAAGSPQVRLHGRGQTLQPRAGPGGCERTSEGRGVPIALSDRGHPAGCGVGARGARGGRVRSGQGPVCAGGADRCSRPGAGGRGGCRGRRPGEWCGGGIGTQPLSGAAFGPRKLHARAVAHCGCRHGPGASERRSRGAGASAWPGRRPCARPPSRTRLRR